VAPPLTMRAMARVSNGTCRHGEGVVGRLLVGDVDKVEAKPANGRLPDDDDNDDDVKAAADGSRDNEEVLRIYDTFYYESGNN